MNIYDNGFLKLDYDPGTDILSVVMPPVDNILLPEIGRSFGIIVEHVRNYDIKKMLVDARETKVDVDEDAIKPIISEFADGLATTRLKRIARLVSANLEREHMVKQVFKDKQVPISFESFMEEGPALEWLIAEKSTEPTGL